VPMKPLHPCNQQGCPELVRDGRYCDKHKKEKQKVQDQRRGSAASRGYDKTHQRIRLQVLREEPLCRRCAAQGFVVAAIEVHHIDGNAYNRQRSNLEPLCKSCHSEHTAREQAFRPRG